MDRNLRAALAAIDGALVLDHEHNLRAMAAVVQGGVTAGEDAPSGTRTRAALRLSEGGLAIKISADGNVELFEQGKQTVKLL